jgi:hypothetical protein
MPKVFPVMAYAQKTKISPHPPLAKGGELQGFALKVPLWKRGTFKANGINLWQTL